MASTDLVVFPLDEGGSILVEVDPVERTPVMRGGSAGEAVSRVVATAGDSLQQVLADVGPSIAGVLDRLRESARGPDEMTVEFSVKLSADASVIIARSSSEANFRVTAKWLQHAP